MNYAGGAVIGVPMSIFLLVFWWNTVKWFSRQTVTYEKVPMFWGMITVRRIASVTKYDAEDSGLYTVISAIGMLILQVIVWVNVT